MGHFNATVGPSAQNLSLVSEQFSRMLAFLARLRDEVSRGGRLYLKEEEVGVAYSLDCGGCFCRLFFARSRERSSPEVGLVAEVMAFGITRLLKHSHRPLSTRMTKQTQVTRREEKYFFEKAF